MLACRKVVGLAMPEILSLIRNATRDWHTKVEEQVPVLDPGFTIADYQRLLERFYGFYAGFEPVIARASGLKRHLADWDERARLPLLTHDLLWLGVSEGQLAALPVCARFPETTDFPALFGALYVTEGSTLGGQVIARHLAKSLALKPGSGAGFFYGHGEQTGVKWKVYIQALNAVATEQNQGRIVEAAVEMFRSMSHWLSRDLGSDKSTAGYAKIGGFPGC
jgi:heme oxygenase